MPTDPRLLRVLEDSELTASATAAEAGSVAERAFSAYTSTNRTCEMGMTRAIGPPYQHLLELVDRANS